MFKCKENCGKCCYGVIFSNKCWDKNKHKIQVRDFKILPIKKDEFFIETSGQYCIFLNRNTKKCEIYEDRPEICREYGVNVLLPCPFLMSDGSERTNDKTKEWEDTVNKQINNFKNITTKIMFKSGKYG